MQIFEKKIALQHYECRETSLLNFETNIPAKTKKIIKKCFSLWN